MQLPPWLGQCVVFVLPSSTKLKFLKQLFWLNVFGIKSIGCWMTVGDTHTHNITQQNYTIFCWKCCSVFFVAHILIVSCCSFFFYMGVYIPLRGSLFVKSAYLLLKCVFNNTTHLATVTCQKLFAMLSVTCLVAMRLMSTKNQIHVKSQQPKTTIVVMLTLLTCSINLSNNNVKSTSPRHNRTTIPFSDQWTSIWTPLEFPISTFGGILEWGYPKQSSI